MVVRKWLFRKISLSFSLWWGSSPRLSSPGPTSSIPVSTSNRARKVCLTHIVHISNFITVLHQLQTLSVQRLSRSFCKVLFLSNYTFLPQFATGTATGWIYFKFAFHDHQRIDRPPDFSPSAIIGQHFFVKEI